MSDLGFVHRFIPGREGGNIPVLLLLHGTGGDEEDLIPLGQSLLPGAALLSLRGKVLENGMPRFFRRIAEGVFDLEDLKLRTDELADFLGKARTHYGLGENPLIAVGYSNGANIAASLMLRHPRHLSAAVLFRATVPFQPDVRPDPDGVPIFLGGGQTDPIVPAEKTAELANVFQAAGAQVSVHWHPGGHELGTDDLAAARLWLTQLNFERTPDRLRRV
jgi:phospholipase/carboxylesterase/glyoxalase family protein